MVRDCEGRWLLCVRHVRLLVLQFRCQSQYSEIDLSMTVAILPTLSEVDVNATASMCTRVDKDVLRTTVALKDLTVTSSRCLWLVLRSATTDDSTLFLDHEGLHSCVV